MPLGSRIVEAVGVSANALDPARRPLAKQIEEAMSQAVRDAQAEGVTDADELKRRMSAARARVRGAE